MAITGDTALGGQDVDNALVEYFREHIAAEHDGLKLNKKAIQKLRAACKDAK